MVKAKSGMKQKVRAIPNRSKSLIDVDPDPLLDVGSHRLGMLVGLCDLLVPEIRDHRGNKGK